MSGVAPRLAAGAQQRAIEARTASPSTVMTTKGAASVVCARISPQ